MEMLKLLLHLLTIIIIVAVHCNGWSPAGTHIKTSWASKVDPNKVWSEYPRPQLTRENNWLNLNGLWNYSITPIATTALPTKYDGEILVPFPVESSLSGVLKSVSASQALWYHRSFKAPEKTADELIVVHFGAVDYHTTLYINGQSVGEHIGGYDSFSFDVTKYLTTSAEQSIVLRVTDATGGSQPIGKQRPKPDGIWYTSTTGIWQTVWLEKVAQHYITSLKITPDIDSSTVEIVINTNTPNDHTLTADIKIVDTDLKVVAANEKYAVNTAGSKLTITSPTLWSTTNPHLYTIQIKYESDSIGSYFGMRKIEVKKDAKGIFRFFLNKSPIFMFGPLDQGFWPDGIYLAPNEDALKYDLEITKQFGFNTIRKHVKVEPERWYYWADRMGFMVWQDFPSAFDNVIDEKPDAKRTAADSKQIESEMQRMVTQLYNHPSIVVWVPFNEGWGQYDTPRVVGLFKAWDQSRLVNEASGWTNRNASNILDHHSYPSADEIPNDSHRVTATGEYGGGGLKVVGHDWDPTKSFDYQGVNNTAELQKFFIDRLATVRANAIFGLGAAIYTQTTDCETEINGLVTYDRALFKVNSVENVRKYVDKLYPSESVSSILLKAGHLDANQEWSYTIAQPSGNWTQLSYDSSAWKKDKAGFGTAGTPAITIHTVWNTDDIWLRREFDIAAGKLPKHPVLHIFYDEYASVYINGVEILANVLNPYQVRYAAFDFDASLLKEGKNMIAIHCHNVYGGQGIDAGIIDVCYDNCA